MEEGEFFQGLVLGPRGAPQIKVWGGVKKLGEFGEHDRGGGKLLLRQHRSRN